MSDLVRIGADLFPDQSIYYGDSTFFDVFSFKLLHSSSEYPLAGKDHAVVTRSVAMRYFGKADVIGERILLNDRDEFAITGVMEDIPPNCHFHFDVLLSMASHYWEPQANWNGSVFATYFKLRPEIDQTYLAEKINVFLKNHEVAGSYIDDGLTMEVFLQPIHRIHLHSHYDDELEANNNHQYILIFLTVALFILLIAGINYINLETARSIERAKEVGLRKIFGGDKKLLMWQFMGESLVTVLISFILSVGLIELIRPYFNRLVDLNFKFQFLFSGMNLIWIILILVMLAFLAGFYPAIVLSGFRPDQVLKGKFSRSKEGTLFRKYLVVLQFAISVALIIGSLVIFRQMEFMRTKNLGINKDQIIVVPMHTKEVISNQQQIKNAFTDHLRILSGTAVSQIPVNITFMEGISFNDGFSVEDLMFFTLEADQDVF